MSVSNYLAFGYHPERKFSDYTLSYNMETISGINSEYIRDALAQWSAVSGLKFHQVDTAAQLTFYSSGWSSFSVSNVVGGEILSSDVYVSPLTSIVGRDFLHMTWLHEIGHALGLGHAGPYNGNSATHADRIFAEDTTDYTVLSYFGDPVTTLQEADILAIQLLYPDTNHSDPIYPVSDSVSGLTFEVESGTTVIGTNGDDYITILDPV
jgi:serralysin